MLRTERLKLSTRNFGGELVFEGSLILNVSFHPLRSATTLREVQRVLNIILKKLEYLHLDIEGFVVYTLKFVHLESWQANFDSEEKTRLRENLLVCVLDIVRAANDRS